MLSLTSSGVCSRIKSDFYLFYYDMMKELETFLNSLIKRGRKPWGLRYFIEVFVSGVEVSFLTKKNLFSNSNLRSIVSLESGLWQFVCRNNLYKQNNEKFRESVSKVWINIWWFAHNYEYRLLESALIPEEELAKFLLDNIKI